MVASLAHRVSGLILILFILFFLCFLHAVNTEGMLFTQLQEWMHSTVGQLFLWLGGASLMYHWCNGLRFVLLDAGMGEQRQSMRTSARLALAAGAVALLLMGVWL